MLLELLLAAWLAALLSSEASGGCPCGNPQLCKSLPPTAPRPPFEVVAYHTAPSYGASPNDWQRTFDFDVITTVAKFLANDFNLTCHAHAHGARVIDWTGIGSLGPNPTNEPWIMTNVSARQRWIHDAVEYLLSLGLDGAVLDIEGVEDTAGSEGWNATTIGEVRAGMVATVCELRTALDVAIPGALLTFNTNWFDHAPSTAHPVPTDAVYDAVGIAECVDFLNPMAYCFSDAVPRATSETRSAGACAPLPALRAGLQSLLARGVPRHKLAPLLPWIGEDFNCDLGAAPVGGRTNAHNCTTSPASQHTIDQPGGSTECPLVCIYIWTENP
jgi:hypothetical protein